MGRRLHERARIFQRPVTGVREGCEGAGAEEHSIPLKTIHIISREQAQNTPAPVTTYALFKNGEFLTQGIQSDKKFLKLAGVQV
ncbi:YoaP domain-containing protein [Bifidobacterium adolescentis]|uniref:YoaP domain-containing protein n=1 Tax=Bifidobacterium adolescentis TaxID=1680 RepID=UPI00216AE771|nr:YoaP domain-containing protein [Bifidobacterium adolescentis]